MKLQQLPQGCSFNRPKAPAVMIVKQFLGFFRAEALDHTYNVLRLTLYVNRYWRAGLEQVFRLLYCFFVIEHERRRILHFNVTRHPTAEWSDKLHARQTQCRGVATFRAPVVTLRRDFGYAQVSDKRPSK